VYILQETVLIWFGFLLLSTLALQSMLGPYQKTTEPTMGSDRFNFLFFFYLSRCRDANFQLWRHFMAASDGKQRRELIFSTCFPIKGKQGQFREAS